MAAPLAARFGMSMNELVSVIMAYGKAGVKAEEAGNAIARSLLRIKKGGASKEMIEAAKSTNTFTEMMAKLDKQGYFKNLTKAQKDFGIYAGKNVLQFANVASEAENFKKQLDGDQSAGAALNKLNLIMDTTEGKINKLKAAWDNLFISQGGGTTTIGFFADSMRTLLQILNEFPAATTGAIVGIGGVGAALLAYTKIFPVIKSHPYFILAALIIGVSAAALVAWDNIKKMNAEVAVSYGFLSDNPEIEKANVLREQADRIKAKYQQMTFDQLRQEQLKLAGTLKTRSDINKKIQEETRLLENIKEKGLNTQKERDTYAVQRKKVADLKAEREEYEKIGVRAETYLALLKPILPLKKKYIS